MTLERGTPLDRLEDLGPGDVGAWVRMPDGTVGQVWARGGVDHGSFGKGYGPTRPAYPAMGRWSTSSPRTVWVADGLVYHEVAVAALVLADPPDETGGLW
jgi:hypothetical protein